MTAEERTVAIRCEHRGIEICGDCIAAAIREAVAERTRECAAAVDKVFGKFGNKAGKAFGVNEKEWKYYGDLAAAVSEAYAAILTLLEPEPCGTRIVDIIRNDPELRELDAKGFWQCGTSSPIS